MHPQKGRRAFSILELVVIVALCIVAAATITPRFAAAGDQAVRDAMREQVRSLNAQVDAFRRDHAGATPTVGGAGAQGWATLIQGGYLAQPPVNAYLGLSVVAPSVASPALLTAEDMPSSAEVGWFAHPLRGRIVANGFDHIRGVFHDEPGYDPKSFAW